MKTLKNLSLVWFASLFLFTTGCKKETVTDYTDGPIGMSTTLKTGSLARQNSPGTPDTKGSLVVVKDAKNAEFLKLNADFQSGFATGTVAVYLAKSDGEIKAQRTAAASNIQAIGFVNKNGEQYLKVNGSSAGFTHIVLYCETAEVNFAAAPLK
ncbi:MAG: hypothetical protein V4714_22995 [Bacteroidota bacterium]